MEAKEPNKLAWVYSGPYRVLQKMSSLNYELEMFKYVKLKLDVIDVAQIKKYNMRN